MYKLVREPLDYQFIVVSGLHCESNKSGFALNNTVTSQTSSLY